MFLDLLMFGDRDVSPINYFHLAYVLAYLHRQTVIVGCCSLLTFNPLMSPTPVSTRKTWWITVFFVQIVSSKNYGKFMQAVGPGEMKTCYRMSFISYRQFAILVGVIRKIAIMQIIAFPLICFAIFFAIFRIISRPNLRNCHIWKVSFWCFFFLKKKN